MKTSTLLLVPALLLGFLAGVHPSNPDSEIVQEKCESEDIEKVDKSTQVDSQAKSLPESENRVNARESTPNTDSQVFIKSKVNVEIPSKPENGGKGQESAPVPNPDSQVLLESEVYVEVPSEDVNNAKAQRSAPMRMAENESDSEILRDDWDKGNVPESEANPKTGRQTKSLGIDKEVANPQRSAAMQKAEGQLRSLLVSDRAVGMPIIRVVRPFRTASGLVFRQVAVYEKLDNADDRGSIWKDLANNQQSGNNNGRRPTPAAFVNQGARNPNNPPPRRPNPGAAQSDYRGNPGIPERESGGTPFSGVGANGQSVRPSAGQNPNNGLASRRQNPGGVQSDYRGNPGVQESEAYIPPNIAGTPFSGVGANSQGIRPSAGQNPNNIPSRRQNPGGVQSDYRGNPGISERESDAYIPPNNAGTPFSGVGASSQGMRPSAGQNPNNVPPRRQNPGGVQSDNRGNPGVPERSSDAYNPPINPGTPFSGGGANGQGVRNPSNAQSSGQNPNNVPPRRQNPNGGQTDQRGRPVNPPLSREPNREVAPGPAYRPQNTRGTPNRNVSPDSNLFAGIVNDFAFKLVEQLNPESNFVISPLSIFVALSMCYLGSDRQTKAQLEQALGLNEYAVHGQPLHKGIRDLLALISSQTPEDQLLVANGMFLGRNFTVDARFAEEIQRYYAAELKNVDFGNPAQSMSVINDWVSKSTRNTIPNLIDRPPPAITRMLLMNAVYFKGVWKTQFPPDLTYNGRFHTPVGGSKEVPTMVLLDETFPLYRSDDQRHSFIKLPYDGDRVSMIIALPYTESERPMPTVRDQTLCHIMDAMKDAKLDTVTLPKFKLEEVMSLRRPLLQLGVSDIFSLQAANLSKMRRQNDIYVSAILHKAVVEVNEQGTTAAAVTGVRFVPLSIRNTSDFLVDHPFAFYIVHEPSGLVLFYGKIYDIGENSRSETPPRPYSDASSGNSEAYRSPNPSRVRIHGAVTFDDEP